MSFLICRGEGVTIPFSFYEKTLSVYINDKIGELDRLKDESMHYRELWRKVWNRTSGVMNRTLDDGDVIDVLRKWVREKSREPLIEEVKRELWSLGVKSGELRLEVYSDVVESFNDDLLGQYQIVILDSIPTEIQQLFFQHSCQGDLSQRVRAYFDKNADQLSAPKAYQDILRELGARGEEVVFVSESLEELGAAQDTQIRVIQMIRGERPVKVGSFPVIRSLLDLKPDLA